MAHKARPSYSYPCAPLLVRVEAPGRAAVPGSAPGGAPVVAFAAPRVPAADCVPAFEAGLAAAEAADPFTGAASCAGALAPTDSLPVAELCAMGAGLDGAGCRRETTAAVLALLLRVGATPALTDECAGAASLGAGALAEAFSVATADAPTPAILPPLLLLAVTRADAADRVAVMERLAAADMIVPGAPPAAVPALSPAACAIAACFIRSSCACIASMALMTVSAPADSASSAADSAVDTTAEPSGRGTNSSTSDRPTSTAMDEDEDAPAESDEEEDAAWAAPPAAPCTATDLRALAPRVTLQANDNGTGV